MRQIVAKALDAGIDDISIKATTSEKIGFIGREEGIAAYAVVLLAQQ
jgi:2-C-methyl-D-erythritol 2,4-cyclodiphosphate synthase